MTRRCRSWRGENRSDLGDGGCNGAAVLDEMAIAWSVLRSCCLRQAKGKILQIVDWLIVD